MDFRIEHDSLGELKVPASALYAAQTQRAIVNFPISGLRMSRAFIRALGLVKRAAAEANGALGLLPKDVARAIAEAAREVEEGRHDAHFPVDVFQTGSGTSSNMNANEVIATLASTRRRRVHPNDHVNLGQSSNDVIPTVILVAASLEVTERLLPALVHLRRTIDRRARGLARVVKTGRTHLMDAMPLTFGQELSCWSAQLVSAEARIRDSRARLLRLPLGGTAVGTGVNAHPRFARRAIAALARHTKLKLVQAGNLFEGIAGQDAAVEMSGQLVALATALMKIGNDLRLMNSGPLAGLGEIALPALQPGSSIMPGKVNPVVPEALCMVCAQVMGNHTTIAIAGASGSFQLNVMLPVIAHNLLESLHILAGAVRVLADSAIAGFTVREARVGEALARNPILVTSLNPVIGYEKAASIAKRAYAEARPIAEVVREQTSLDPEAIRALLDPETLTRGGLPGTRGPSRRRAR